jgi:hypothetical protein
MTASATELEMRLDRERARDLGPIGEREHLAVRALAGCDNVWLALSLNGTDVAYVRLGPAAGEMSHVQILPQPDGTALCECTTPLGPARVRISVHEGPIVRCTTSLLPVRDTIVTKWPRDVYAAEGGEATVHTTQRGLRSGIVFASSSAPRPFSVLYFQNFSALNGYFSQTKRTPADTVGGTWPELGYAPPAGNECILAKAREVTVSDAFVALSADAPRSDDAIARLYLDTLAQIYALLEKPAVRYHDWQQRAANALRDLSLSPACTYVRQGRRYLMPYVADPAKPPESMVQLTLAVNAGEYDSWRNEQSALFEMLRRTTATFYREDIGSVVRWLPGEPFEDGQAEDNMNHEAMDSWYLHHALFNVFRLARDGDAGARELFERSLPYVVRVARRFGYRWPIFFNLETLDIIRAEAAPGSGGENDVAGLYALVMIHAYEMFGVSEYLREAEAAIVQLQGLGFKLAYQLNTTGFAAEAALRLWKMTKKQAYLGLSESCMANLFDNMWLWQCDYGHARHYRTFFGLFPLRDAPYLAAYEELEAHAKFHEYLALGGADLRPSLQFLLAEYQKYALDRCWYYYPDVLPIDVVAGTARNGRSERGLSVPLEDLRDGREQSGQVGQELYGAGLPFVMTSRHYVRLGATGMLAYCDYPMFDFAASNDGGAWRAGGDLRGTCLLRVLPADARVPARAVFVRRSAGSTAVPVRGSVSVEGHAVFELRGGQTVTIACTDPSEAGDDGVVIGAVPVEGRR